MSNLTSADMWWHYPTFKLGSYDQITNNIRYPNNPDVGRCTPASVCGALYHEKKTGSTSEASPDTNNIQKKDQTSNDVLSLNKTIKIRIFVCLLNHRTLKLKVRDQSEKSTYLLIEEMNHFFHVSISFLINHFLAFWLFSTFSF